MKRQTIKNLDNVQEISSKDFWLTDIRLDKLLR